MSDPKKLSVMNMKDITSLNNNNVKNENIIYHITAGAVKKGKLTENNKKEITNNFNKIVKIPFAGQSYGIVLSKDYLIGILQKVHNPFREYVENFKLTQNDANFLLKQIPELKNTNLERHLKSLTIFDLLRSPIYFNSLPNNKVNDIVSEAPRGMHEYQNESLLVGNWIGRNTVKLYTYDDRGVPTLSKLSKNRLLDILEVERRKLTIPQILQVLTTYENLNVINLRNLGHRLPQGVYHLPAGNGSVFKIGPASMSDTYVNFYELQENGTVKKQKISNPRTATRPIGSRLAPRSRIATRPIGRAP